MDTDQSEGSIIRGELHSANASAGAKIPLYNLNGDERILGPLHALDLRALRLISVAGGDAYIFWDLAAQGLDITAAVAGTTDTFATPGDLTQALEVGDTFYVHGSTGSSNDGAFTVESISYDLASNTTTISVVEDVTDTAADGVISLTYYPIVAANHTAETLGMTGDLRKVFKVGRKFAIDGSAANDLATTTVTAVAYSATTGITTVTVAAVTDSAVGGYIVPLNTGLTNLAGMYAMRGTYAANSGESMSFDAGTMRGPVGYQLFGVCPSGVVDFGFRAVLHRNLVKTLPSGGTRVS